MQTLQGSTTAALQMSHTHVHTYIYMYIHQRESRSLASLRGGCLARDRHPEPGRGHQVLGACSHPV